MKRLTYILMVFALVFGLQSAAFGKSVEDLDAVMDKASSLNDFLARPELQTEYYDTMAKYFHSGEFVRPLFDGLIEQMRALAKDNATFANQAWRKDGLSSNITLTSDVPDWGRDLNQEKWSQAFELIKANLQADIEKVFPATMPKSEILTAAQALETELIEFEKETQRLQLTPKQTGPRNQEFYTKLRQHPQLSAILSAMTLQKLNESAVAQDMRSGKAVQILFRFLTLKGQGSVAWSLDGVPLRGLTGLARNKIPNVDAMLKQEDVFPKQVVKTRNGEMEKGKSSVAEYNFRAVRPFHSFFSGICHNECVGGAKSRNHKATPERWATGALKGADVFFLESNASYNGNVRMNLVNHPTGIYKSLDLMASDLNKTIVQQGKSGQLHSMYVYEALLERANSLNAHQVKGFLFGEGAQLGNEGNPVTVFESDSYKYAKTVGMSEEFSHPDPLAKQIPAWARRQGLPGEYGDRMITEVTVAKAGKIKMLRVPEIPDLVEARRALAPQCRTLFAN